MRAEHPRDVGQMLQVLVEAERCAIRTYTEVCNMTFGKDHRTCEVALAILHEEVEHEASFSEYLSEGPSGHLPRGAPGASPYVWRFMLRTSPEARQRNKPKNI
jgi:ferritin-like protein